MLESCLKHCEIYSDLDLSLSLHRLSHIARVLYPCGYSSAPKKTFSLSYSKIKKLLKIHRSINSEILVQEIFRYAVTFGIIRDVVISPFHIEWSINPHHQRDLFFAELRFHIRKSHKHFLSL